MNRIHHPSKLRALRREPTDPAFSIEAGLFTPSRDNSRVLFVPVHYEPRYPYPLIVWLHGADADERQLLRVMPIISMRNYVAVAPRGISTIEEGPNGDTPSWPQTPEHIQEAAQRVFDGIEAAREKYRIGRNRVFLAGFDRGGTMAFRLAMAHPAQFAGVISLSGAFPGGLAPLSQLTEARRLSAFLAVCRDSGEYPPAAACADLRLFHAAGISITLRQYPCGHQLSPLMLRDMDRWIIEQVTTSAACETQPSDRCL